jgi:hypothetical protein
MEQTSGIKSVTITPLDKGMVAVSAHIEMPDMSCTIAVQLDQSNYTLHDLQIAVLQKAIDSLSKMKEMKRREIGY